MLLCDLVHTSRRLAETSSRLEKIARLSSYLERLSFDEIAIGVSYCVGRLRQGNIGIGPALLQAAQPAQAAHHPCLTLTDVDQGFEKLAHTTGPGSAEARLRLLRALLAKATRDEQQFLAQLIQGALRQGAMEGIMVEAIARAAHLPVSEVRRALMLEGDLAAVAQAALAQGTVQAFHLTLFKPVLPMLAQPVSDLSEALEHLGEAAFEYKMDGVRIQLHKMGHEVRVFTRTLHDVTHAVPELVELAQGMPAQTVVLDGEVLAFRVDGTPHPFQTTMRRFGRKTHVATLRHHLPLTPFFFDCLHLAGEDLIDQPTRLRVAALQQVVPEPFLTPRFVTPHLEEARQFFKQALAAGHEGVMAKALDAPYEAGCRGSTWLKMKHIHTLDLVILAAEWGHGRRKGWLSNLHLGARDPASGQFVMLGKTFKGLTDALLEWQTQTLQTLKVAQDESTVYVRPELVVEIAFNDIQASPHYPAGLALRFARVKRFRPDKSANQADTIDTVRALYTRLKGGTF
ncbi:MAG: ATP-dependent DNA ligase [Nitrospirae bacterium]|nr:MAG: ATP-dependent DNA ligase [Nitrospirota bacterium]